MNQPLFALLALAAGITGGLIAESVEPFLLIFTGAVAIGAFTGALINAYRHDDLAYGATVGSLFGGVFGLALAILDGLLGS